MAAEYRPWRFLRDHPEIEVGRGDMPEAVKGVLAERDGLVAILLNRELLRPWRDATLWHELIHWRRGGSGHRPGLPPNLKALVDKEEVWVDLLVALALIPDERLEPFVRRIDPMTWDEVADELEVPVEVLRRRFAS